MSSGLISRWFFVTIQISPMILYWALILLKFYHPAVDLIMACIWGLLIFQSLLGYGNLFLLTFSANEMTVLAGPVVGLAALFSMGGLLNLSSLFLRPIGLGIIIFGACIFITLNIMKLINKSERIHDGNNCYTKKSSLDVLIYLLTLLVIFVAYVGSAIQFNFNIHDDAHAYLYFPHKLLELGSLGTDPYSERRVLSGFGTSSLWYAFGLFQIKTPFIHIMDMGVGLLMLAYVLLQFPLAENFYKAKLLCLIAVSLIAFPVVNITPNFLSISIIFSIWCVVFTISNQLYLRKKIDSKYWVLLGIGFFVLISLKNTYIPYVALTVLFVLVLIILAFRVTIRTILAGLTWVGLSCICLLIPWAIDLKQGAGTYFYPFLGKGFHASAYGNFSAATEGFLFSQNWLTDLMILFAPLTKSVLLISIIFLFISLFRIIYLKISDKRWLFVCLPLLTSLLNVLVVGFAIGGYGAYRYVYAPALASLLATLFGSLYLLTNDSKKNSRWRLTTYLIILMFGIRAVQDSIVNFEERKTQFVQSILMGESVLGIDSRPYEELSKAIPSDAGVLIRLDYPFLIRPIGHHIFIADYPGSASPKPGMPIKQGPEALRLFLLSQGIRYIVWGYGNQANFKYLDYGDRLAKNTHTWIRNEAMLAFDFQDNVEILRKKYSNIYDHDGIAIIDLR